MKDGILSEPVYVTVSDQYNEYVRSGLIRLVRGKVTKTIEGTTDSILNVDGEEEIVLDDVAAVVFASGFDARPSIDFLPEEILQTLDFDPSGDKFPLGLDMHGAVSRHYPSLGFVGFYRSPYWGVMEKQAQFLGKLWTGDGKAAKALAEDDSREKMLKLRNNPRAAQFPMGDYAYLMESFSDILGIQRIEPSGTEAGVRTGIVLPARYLDPNANESQGKQSSRALEEVDKIFMESAESARFVQRAIFKAMQGVWKLERVIDSRRSDYPSGTLLGTAQFHPRAPTDEKYDMELLYNESGEFISPQGFRFTATRRYVHHSLVS